MRFTVVLALALISSVAHADILKVGERAVEFDAAIDAAGKPWKLASHRGRWLVLSIGAAWCGPCKDELPVWDRLARETGARVLFVAVAIDNDVADGKAFHKRIGLAHMARVYLPEEVSKVVGRYGASTMPATFLIGPDGVVRYIQLEFHKAMAQREYEKLRDAIAKHVPKPAVKPKPEPTKPPPPRTPAVSIVPPLVWPAAGTWTALPRLTGF
jgi:thiol-disulfide isomerase/thioredoxin